MARCFRLWPVLVAMMTVLGSCSFDRSGLNAPGDPCSDHVLNGEETDVDCGGTVCSPCGDSLNCVLNRDCASGICSNAGECIVLGTCDDSELNGHETDMDCGGQDCPLCEDGKICIEGSDCQSGFCSTEGRCAQPLPCEDQERNGLETDVDCGGGECPLCPDGAACLVGADCESKVCDALGLCAEVSCFDSVQNGLETDINCGGGVCPPCVQGEHCLVATDCLSRICDSLHQCTESSCIDGVTNGEETDQDCGGPECSPCIAGKNCRFGSDCLSLICDVGDLCTAASCDDLVLNGQEIDVDCGGPLCPACSAGAQCYGHADCASGYCNGGICENTTSCKALLTVNPSMTPGDYVIDPGPGALSVSCVFDGTPVYTLHYVTSGTATNHKDVNDSCRQAGLILFTPKTQAYYAMGRDYLLGLGISTSGNFLGPLGIYNPSDGDNSGWNQWCEHANYCCYKKMTGGGGSDTVSVDSCGFVALTGSTFWASESTSVSEPNGDYSANCWLGFTYDGSGNVASWNDEGCNYSYASYLCMATDDL